MIKAMRVIIIAVMLTVSFLSFSSTNNEVSVYLRFFNKKIYYLNGIEEIKIKVTVINNSLEPFRFKIADSKVFNLDFEVKTPANRNLDHSKKFNIERKSYQYVFFKEVVLKPEEEYGFVVSLDRFINFQLPGIYTVQALFYADLFTDNRSDPIRSNLLSLNVRPALEDQKQMELVERESGEIIEREMLPPDEVVSFAIKSRQRGQWERFFLYLDVKSLLMNNPEWRVRYEKLPEEGRLRLLEDYTQALKKNAVDQDILVIPQAFEILKTSYSPFEGEVEVLSKFKYPDYTELKQYTYHLERKDRFWMITDYEVQNLGTE